MKLIFLLFLIIIPLTNALTISPTKLDFTLYKNDIQENEFLIYNDNDHKTTYSITSNENFKFYPDHEIKIAPNSFERIRVILESNNESKEYESRIYIKELVKNKGFNFENILAIRTFIKILSIDKEEINETKIEKEIINKEIPRSKQEEPKAYIFLLTFIIILILVFPIIKISKTFINK